MTKGGRRENRKMNEDDLRVKRGNRTGREIKKEKRR